MLAAQNQRADRNDLLSSLVPKSFNLVLKAKGDDDLFKQDASFCLIESLLAGDAKTEMSLHSVNYPAYHIVQDGSNLKLTNQLTGRTNRGLATFTYSTFCAVGDPFSRHDGTKVKYDESCLQEELPDKCCYDNKKFGHIAVKIVGGPYPTAEARKLCDTHGRWSTLDGSRPPFETCEAECCLKPDGEYHFMGRNSNSEHYCTGDWKFVDCPKDVLYGTFKGLYKPTTYGDPHCEFQSCFTTAKGDLSATNGLSVSLKSKPGVAVSSTSSKLSWHLCQTIQQTLQKQRLTFLPLFLS